MFYFCLFGLEMQRNDRNALVNFALRGPKSIIVASNVRNGNQHIFWVEKSPTHWSLGKMNDVHLENSTDSQCYDDAIIPTIRSSRCDDWEFCPYFRQR